MEAERRTEAQGAVGGGAPRVAVGGELLAIEILGVPDVQALAIEADPLLEHRPQVRSVSDVEPAVRLDVTVDAFFEDELAHALARVDPQPHNAPRGREA